MASSVRALFRNMMRTVRELEKESRSLTIRAPPDVTSWGRGEYRKPGVDGPLKVLLDQIHALPGSTLAAGQMTFETDELRMFLSAVFKARRETPIDDAGAYIDDGFSYLRLLHQQVSLERSSSCATTRGVRVEATSVGVPGMSGPQHGKYTWAYRIRLTNVDSVPIQLIGREWQIFDDRQKLASSVPKGSPGVVGHTPILTEGQSFEYVSGTHLATPCGTMSGSFQMIEPDHSNPEDSMFDATIDTFALNPF